MLGHGLGHAHGGQHVLPHVGEEAGARSTLDHGADEVPAVRGVGVARSRRRLEGVAGEDLQGVHHVFVVGAAGELHASVVPDSRQVATQQTGGDGPFRLLGEARHVALRRGVQVQAARLHELAHRRGGEGLRDGGDPELRVGVDPHLVLHVGPPEAFGPDDPAVHRHGHRRSRDAAFLHVGQDGVPGLVHGRGPPAVRRRLGQAEGGLGGERRRRRSQRQQQGQGRGGEGAKTACGHGRLRIRRRGVRGKTPEV